MELYILDNEYRITYTKSHNDYAIAKKCDSTHRLSKETDVPTYRTIEYFTTLSGALNRAYRLAINHAIGSDDSIAALYDLTAKLVTLEHNINQDLIELEKRIFQNVN
jgi:hypothetical protein